MGFGEGSDIEYGFKVVEEPTELDAPYMEIADGTFQGMAIRAVAVKDRDGFRVVHVECAKCGQELKWSIVMQGTMDVACEPDEDGDMYSMTLTQPCYVSIEPCTKCYPRKLVE